VKQRIVKIVEGDKLMLSGTGRNGPPKEWRVLFMTTRFRNYCRILVVGSLVFGGAAAISAVGGSLSSSVAGAASPPAWTAYVVSHATDAVIPVNTATDALGAPIAVGSAPSAIAITPDATTAYVTDEGTTNTAPGFVTPIDLMTNTPGTPIPVGSGPDAIAITPNGSTAYVGNSNDQTVTPVNLVTNTAGTPIPVGTSPAAITITPDGSTAYVTQGFGANVIPIDTATNKAGTGILNTNNGFSSAITPDGSTLYTPNGSYNGVATLGTATSARGSISALNDPEGVAITPDGSTAYVAYTPFTTNKGALLPIATAAETPGTPIPLGTSSAEGVAITPDGSTALVTDPMGGTVVPVDLASGTAATPISLGSEGANPVAIAITPDQAPIAHVHVAALGNSTMSFDASASTVAYGAITSYAWNFGDGSTETTTTPTVTHTYTNTAPNQVATVTETDSTGTSTTGQVYTGQTASRNGSPLAAGRATIYLNPSDAAAEYPTVSAVTPAIGPTSSPSTVTITGTSFWPGQTEVYVGGAAATNVTVNANETSLTATLPARPAGVYDITVTSATSGGQQYYFGSSADTPADRFTYSTSAPPVQVSCTSPSCAIPVVQYGSTTVAATVGSDCNQCAVSALLADGVPPIQLGSEQFCPSAMGYEQPQITVSESGATVNSPLTVVSSHFWAGGLTWGSPPASELGGIVVCADAQALTGGAPTHAMATGGNAFPSAALGQNIRLKKCARRAVAPCVQQVGVNGRTVSTNVLLPVNESITLTVGPEEQTIKNLLPKKGAAPGSSLTITGTNLFQVSAVVIDGDPVGGGLVGGLQASIVSETSRRLVVTVPPGATTGSVTLIGLSGDVTSPATFTVR
jgi:DNA-binding beta-propeller fold protein YncE